MLRILYIGIFYIFCAFSLKEKIPLAQKGDFIVIQEGKNYSLFFIRASDKEKLLLEEITLPLFQMKNSKGKWKEWVAHQAPGHTGWILYTLDLKQDRVESAFCFDKRYTLPVEGTNCFLTTLFSLPLKKVEDSQRRRIGPQPQGDTPDRRSFWKPPVIIEGKKEPGTPIEVLSAKWPNDSSPLASCELQFYFDTRRPHFLFPCWIEIKSPHYTHNLKVIDSGTGITSPHVLIPESKREFINKINTL